MILLLYLNCILDDMTNVNSLRQDSEAAYIVHSINTAIKDYTFCNTSVQDEQNFYKQKKLHQL